MFETFHKKLGEKWSLYSLTSVRSSTILGWHPPLPHHSTAFAMTFMAFFCLPGWIPKPYSTLLTNSFVKHCLSLAPRTEPSSGFPPCPWPAYCSFVGSSCPLATLESITDHWILNPSSPFRRLITPDPGFSCCQLITLKFLSSLLSPDSCIKTVYSASPLGCFKGTINSIFQTESWSPPTISIILRSGPQGPCLAPHTLGSLTHHTHLLNGTWTPCHLGSSPPCWHSSTWNPEHLPS